jgi:hypothetical protein
MIVNLPQHKNLSITKSLTFQFSLFCDQFKSFLSRIFFKQILNKFQFYDVSWQKNTILIVRILKTEKKDRDFLLIRLGFCQKLWWDSWPRVWRWWTDGICDGWLFGGLHFASFVGILLQIVRSFAGPIGLFLRECKLLGIFVPSLFGLHF